MIVAAVIVIAVCCSAGTASILLDVCAWLLSQISSLCGMVKLTLTCTVVVPAITHGTKNIPNKNKEISLRMVNPLVNLNIGDYFVF